MTAPPAFAGVRLSTDSHGAAVQLLPFPKSDAPLLDKVQAFACFEEIIRQHRPQLTALGVQQACADHVPVSSSASASKEADRISSQLNEHFFHVGNLTCLGFFTSDGKASPVDLDPSHRAPDISFVKFSATVDPSAVSSDLLDTPSSTVQCFLKLNESLPPANPADQNQSKSDSPSSPATANAKTPGTPNTIAMTTVRQVFASGRDASDLDFTDPMILWALTSIVNVSSAPPTSPKTFTPDSTRVNLFPATDPPQAASPSILCYLTNAPSATKPTYCGPLDFLNNQILFDAVFPAHDRKPILSLRSPCASATTVRTDDVETAIESCLSECRMRVFKLIIRLDHVGHHNFSSADHPQQTVQRIRKLQLECNERGVAINGSPDRLFDKYLALIPLSPATHVNVWGINLFSQFWTTLGNEITREITQLPR
jgi:hypothetical protein